MSFVRTEAPWFHKGIKEESKTSLRKSCYHLQRQAPWFNNPTRTVRGERCLCILMRGLEFGEWTASVQERWSYYNGYDMSAGDEAKRLFQITITSQAPTLDFINQLCRQTTHERRAKRCGGQAHRSLSIRLVIAKKLSAQGLKTGPLLCEAQGLDLSVNKPGRSFSVFHHVVTLWMLLEHYTALSGNASSLCWWGLVLT